MSDQQFPPNGYWDEDGLIYWRPEYQGDSPSLSGAVKYKFEMYCLDGKWKPIEEPHWSPYMQYRFQKSAPRQKDATPAKTLTGGSSDYYKVEVTHPTTAPDAYTAECNDIIEALGLDFAEGNIVKAIWRSAKARQGAGKSGNSENYDAEKGVFFAVRVLVKAWAKNGQIDIDGVRKIEEAAAMIWAAKGDGK